MLSRQLENALNSAFRDARSMQHEFMTVEHLLLALLGDDETNKILHSAGAAIDELRVELTNHIDATVPKLPNAHERETQPTLAFQRVLQRAVFHIQSSGKREVNACNVLVAIFSEQDSEAVSILKKRGINRIDIVNRVPKGLSESGDHIGIATSSKTVQTARLAEIENKLDQAISEIKELSNQVKALVEKLDSKE